MRKGKLSTAAAVATMGLAAALIPGTRAWAHCDTAGGPVIREATTALEKGDVTPILKWVKEEDEAEITAVFAKTVAVRRKGAEAKDLADRYFLETLVRVHRAGEGEPYTGIKDEPVDAVVAMADEALSRDSVEEMVRKISAHAAAAIEERFLRVSEAGKHKDASVAEGRAFVEAYVAYMHYVESLHAAIVSSGGHAHAQGAEPKAEPHVHGTP